MVISIFMELCNHHHSGLEHFPHERRNPYIPLSYHPQLPLLSPQPQATTHPLSVSVAFPVLDISDTRTHTMDWLPFT